MWGYQMGVEGEWIRSPRIHPATSEYVGPGKPRRYRVSPHEGIVMLLVKVKKKFDNAITGGAVEIPSGFVG